MELAHLALAQLSVSAANMRAGKKLPDVTDLIPTIRARGVLTPLLVRRCDAGDRFEIVAGRRRYHAALAIAEEGIEPPLLPCAIMVKGDDAAAIEASIIENCARIDPDEVTQWVAFTRLVKEGRSVAQVAATFGMTEVQVRRVLALGNLLPRIRDLYAKEEIDAHTVRHLTMASKARQAEWLALYRNPEAHVPTGAHVKHWLCGGQSIPTRFARFDITRYPDPIVTDLFGEDTYFADATSFWSLQGEAIAALRQTYLDAGWGDVVVMEVGATFQRWEHDRASKAKHGKVYITVTREGEIETHEGWLSRSEVRRRERAEQMKGAGPAQRSELTSTLRSYLDLHRHAMVQVALVGNPGVALRLMVAHAITGSWLWGVRPDPLRSPTEAITANHAGCAARAAFAQARGMAQRLLGIEGERDTLVHDGGLDIVEAFERMLGLSDEEVVTVLAVVMAETLAVGRQEVDAAGTALGIDPLAHWQADEAFLTLLRKRDVLQALIGEVAGAQVAAANSHERIKTMRGILGDCLAGTTGRSKSEPWAPRWLHFPAASYLAGDEDVGDDCGDVDTINDDANASDADCQIDGDIAEAA